MRPIQIFCFLLYLRVPHTQGRKVSCSAPDTYQGNEANIACQFDENMSLVQEDVIVFVYKDTGSNPVVTYAWVQGRPVIMMESGFTCNGTISDTLVIKIPEVKHEHSGQYKCLVAPSEKGDSTACTLRVLDLHQMNLQHKDNLAILILTAVLGILIVVFVMILIISYKKGYISKICMKKECSVSTKEPKTKNIYSNTVLDGILVVKEYTKLPEVYA